MSGKYESSSFPPPCITPLRPPPHTCISRACVGPSPSLRCDNPMMAALSASPPPFPLLAFPFPGGASRSSLCRIPARARSTPARRRGGGRGGGGRRVRPLTGSASAGSRLGPGTHPSEGRWGRGHEKACMNGGGGVQGERGRERGTASDCPIQDKEGISAGAHPPSRLSCGRLASVRERKAADMTARVRAAPSSVWVRSATSLAVLIEAGPFLPLIPPPPGRRTPVIMWRQHAQGPLCDSVGTIGHFAADGAMSHNFATYRIPGYTGMAGDNNWGVGPTIWGGGGGAGHWAVGHLTRPDNAHHACG